MLRYILSYVQYQFMRLFYLTMVVIKTLYKTVLFPDCVLLHHGDLAAFGKCSLEGQVFRGKISLTVPVH